LTDKLRSKAKRISDDMNRNGMRVLAIAQKSFITQGSIEEKIIQLQEEKRKLAETFITDTEQLPALTNREWARLLGS
jgi:flagellar motor component MotA